MKIPDIMPELPNTEGRICCQRRSFNHGRQFTVKLTLIERKSRMPQMQGGKGEAVVNYREPFPTQTPQE
jgi:hypothetical protein